MKRSSMEGKSCLCRSLALVAILFSMSPPTLGQGEGVTFGKFVFYPSLELNFLGEDNVFLQNENDPAIGEVSSAQQYYVGTFKVEMPFSRSHASITYSPRFRDYTDKSIDLPDKFSHYLSADSRLQFSRGTELSFEDRFVRDNVTVQEFVGPEVRYGTDTFTTNDFAVNLKHTFLPNHILGSRLRYNFLKFSDDTNPSFFDTTTLEFGLEYDYDYSPTRGWQFEASWSTNDQNFAQLSSFTLREAEDYGSLILAAALEGSGENRLYYNLRTGYQSLRFRQSDDSDFNGIVADLNARYKLTPQTNLKARLSRKIFPSFFDAANYYTSAEIELGVQREISSRLRFDAKAVYLKSRYPDAVAPLTPAFSPSAGVKREDDYYRLEGGFGYQFLRTFSAGITVSYEERDSNVVADRGGGAVYEPFDYDSLRAGFQVLFGWD